MDELFPPYRPENRYVLPIFLILVSLMVVGNPVQAQERAEKSWKISFEGNETFSDRVLRDMIATSRPAFFQRLLGRTGAFEIREMELRRDVIRVERYYQRRGFDQVQVSYRLEPMRRDWKKHVIFEVTEGVPLRVGYMEIEFDSSQESEERIRVSRVYRRAEQRHAWQPGQRYQPIRQTDVEGAFREAMQESGHAYATVEIETELRESSGEVDIRILNRPGPRMRFESFDVTGDYTVDDRIIIRETGIRRGEVYSRASMQTAQRELFNHHLFRFATVSIPEEPSADSTLALTLRVREYPKRSIHTTIGFGREELLRGQVGWQHRNVNGWAHRFGVTGRASFIEQRFGMDYLMPYVFNTRSSFVSSPYAQHRLEPAFELFRIGFTNSLIYRYSERLTGSVSYDLTYNQELTRQPETSLPDTVLNYNTGSFTLSGFYSSSGIRSRIGEGWQIQPSLELSSLFAEGTYSYRKLSLDVRRYQPLNSTLTIAARIEGGLIHSPSTDSLPSTIRYFTGGTNSVRGWSRQTLGPTLAVTDQAGEFDRYVPIGGRALFNFNLELRQDLHGLINRFGMAVFLDGGQVWRTVRRLDERPVQFGAGGGFRYESPIGPIRVDIGYKLNPTDEDLNIYAGQRYGSAWNRLGFHFSIGQAF